MPFWKWSFWARAKLICLPATLSRRPLVSFTMTALARWLTNVDGTNDLWCSSTTQLLSTQIWMGRRIYGALVQFSCYQHRFEWMAGFIWAKYLRGNRRKAGLLELACCMLSFCDRPLKNIAIPSCMSWIPLDHFWGTFVQPHVMRILLLLNTNNP